jgi:orotate phosphoribosyltransferase
MNLVPHAAMTARMILEAGAVKYRSERPYFLSSGWASPVYIDVQRLISFPRIRSALMDLASETILATIGFEQFDAIAGVEPSGIAYGAWIAERLSLPLQYVRRHPHGFGREAQIAGTLRPGARVLMVDDVSTDCRSKIDLAQALREIDARIEHAMVLFFYDVFAEARTLLSELQLRLHYLATWRDIVAEAHASSYFPPAALEEIERFVTEPERWSLDHGGVGAFSKER